MNFKGSLLLDESVNLGDISTSSFGTPLPAKGAPDLDDSPVALPRFTEKDDESGDEHDVAPPSPLDDKVLSEASKETEADATPRRISKRDRTPTPQGVSEPQTPSRRPKIQITIEIESIIVSTHVCHSRRWLILGVKTKIWSTIGGLIQPGYQHPGEGKTLRAKETMCVLLCVTPDDSTDE